MPDKIIAATLSVNTGNSNTEIKEVNKNLSDVKSNLKETGTAAKSTGKDIEGTTGHFGNLKDKLTSMPGPLGQAGQGVNSLGSAFKALLANPVVLVLTAIVGVLALLYKAFTNTFAGGQKVEQVFSGIKAAATVVLDRVFALGNALIKFFSGDYKGAAEQAKAAISGVGDEVAKTYKQVADLTKEAQALKKEQLQNDLEGAERAKKLAILREQANDADVSPAKRKAALLELRKDAEQNSKDDIDLAARVTKNKIALLSIGTDAAKKNQEEINQLKIEQINIETQNADELRRIGKQVTSIDKQEQSERKAQSQKSLDERNEALAKYKLEQKKINDDGNRAIDEAEKVLQKSLDRPGQLLLLKNEYEERKALARKAGLDILKINEAWQKERNDMEAGWQQEDDEKEQAKKSSLDKLLKDRADSTFTWLATDKATKDNAAKDDIRTAEEVKAAKIKSAEDTANALGVLSNVVGQQTVVGKGFAIADATINSYLAGTRALAAIKTAKSPFEAIAGIATMIAVIGAGLATVKKIAGVKVPGMSGGGGNVSTSSISNPAPLTATQQSTTINQDQVNQMGNATVRAYVVDTDVDNNRTRNERLNRAARLG
ncbi:MAG: hypothetical protein JWQ09_1780 [Segetibacter sp.]|nr:hypothetical protein [Segetibacter sp.]